MRRPPLASSQAQAPRAVTWRRECSRASSGKGTQNLQVVIFADCALLGLLRVWGTHSPTILFFRLPFTAGTRQQDASQFFEHLLDSLDKAHHAAGAHGLSLGPAAAGKASDLFEFDVEVGLLALDVTSMGFQRSWYPPLSHSCLTFSDPSL